MDLQTI